MTAHSVNNEDPPLLVEKNKEPDTTNNSNANQEEQEIIAKLEIQKYVTEWKEIYNNFIAFIENPDSEEADFQKLNELITKQKLSENHENFNDFLKLIVNIANNHHRGNSFFTKIFKIISYYTDQIKQNFSNYEIYDIFQDNKKILLFLFENKVIIFDDDIMKQILSKTEKNGNRYCYFFYPEIKNLCGQLEKIENIEKILLSKDSSIFDRFDEKRHEGENDSYLCSLIRNDSVEEFITYVNKSNIPINSEVTHSIFETNLFLIENNPTLIEYSAFYGAIQIFNYLKMKAELKPSLWLYSIHSNNSELIYLIENDKIQPPNKKYDQCFSESIKCHHNNVSNYLLERFLEMNEVLSRCIYEYRNYQFFPSDFQFNFYYLCCYGYKTLVKLFIKQQGPKFENIIKEQILNYIYY